jgi:hypothetical protein
MEIALGGRPDDSAKIVCSRGCIAYLFQIPLKRQRNFHLPTHSAGWAKALIVRWLWLQQFRSIYAAAIGTTRRAACQYRNNSDS